MGALSHFWVHLPHEDENSVVLFKPEANQAAGLYKRAQSAIKTIAYSARMATTDSRLCLVCCINFAAGCQTGFLVDRFIWRHCSRPFARRQKRRCLTGDFEHRQKINSSVRC
jgi:hypothetical protein